ncbi:transketolase [Candidatus Pacearchaeota archaeon]|nr:transketolase [Candidatus Pacearchaeota archaeon]
MQLAPYYNLSNLCAIIDINRLGQRGETMVGWNIDKYSKRFASFGWEVEIINGHNIAQIISAFRKFRRTKRPFVILAKTVKGKGISFLENKEGLHGRTLTNTELKNALDEIHIDENIDFRINKSRPAKNNNEKLLIKKPFITRYAQNISIATREAYGNALSNLAKTNKNILAVDAEVSNSTFAEKVKFSAWRQFIEAFVAEQNMISLSLGLSIKGFNVFTSSFAAFLTRAHDQLRMAALSKAPMTVCGSHAGVSIGQDGASQMGLDDISMFRDLPQSIIFYPSDAISTEKITQLAATLNKNSIKYIRTTRPKTPIIYLPKEIFFLGDFKILRKSGKDKIVLIGAGITLHESIKANEILNKKNINSAVIDLYCIKPLKIRKLISFIKKHGKRVIVTEDHYEEGGIGEMLNHELSNTGIKISNLAIKETPHSGTTEELLRKYCIDSDSIARAAIKLLSS